MNLLPPDVRSLVIECLRKERPFNPQALPFRIDALCREVAAIAKTRGLKTARGNHAWIDSRHQDPSLHPHVIVEVHSIIWDLIVEGIVRPGHGEQELDLPAIHVTEHGMESLKGAITPYDPEGYLTDIITKVPAVDPIIVKYIAESAETLRRNCLLSSTITLGCASEKAFLLVIDAYRDGLSPAEQAKFAAAIDKARTIKRQHAEFKTKWYEPKLRPALAKVQNSDWMTSLDDCMQFVFAYFRDVRNDAGHPTGIIFTREKVHSHLVIFPYYLRIMHDLIEWIEANKPL